MYYMRGGSLLVASSTTVRSKVNSKPSLGDKHSAYTLTTSKGFLYIWIRFKFEDQGGKNKKLYTHIYYMNKLSDAFETSKLLSII